MENISKLADLIGFRDLRLQLITYDLSNSPLLLNYQEYNQITSRNHFSARILKHINSCMKYSNIFYLTKGHFVPDSRNLYGLRHKIEVHPSHFRIKAREDFSFKLEIKNNGMAKWLHSNISDIGVVKIGYHLYDSNYNLISFDYGRDRLDDDVYPGQSVIKEVSLCINEPGEYYIGIDLVSEHVCWFGKIDSDTVNLRVQVI